MDKKSLTQNGNVTNMNYLLRARFTPAESPRGLFGANINKTKVVGEVTKHKQILNYDL
jgi:hypothetical protein